MDGKCAGPLPPGWIGQGNTKLEQNPDVFPEGAHLGVQAFKAAEGQCVSPCVARTGLVPTSVRAVRLTWNTYSLSSAPIYLNFIHSSRLIKSHLLHEGFSIYESTPSPGPLLYLQSVLGFHMDVDHASLECFLSFRVPSCALRSAGP